MYKIEEGNRLIAKFMEIPIIQVYNQNKQEHIPAWKNEQIEKASLWVTCDKPQWLKFHSDWNWLMPVVENIEELDMKNEFYSWNYDDEVHYNFEGFSIDMENKKCMVYAHMSLDPIFVVNKETFNINFSSKIEAVWNAIVEFIEWYNKNKT
jgi:hypothetical protein